MTVNYNFGINKEQGRNLQKDIYWALSNLQLRGHFRLRGQLNKAELVLTHMIERCLKRCEADDLSGYSAYAFIDVFGLDKLDRT